MNYKIKRIIFIRLLLNLLHFIFLMICNLSILKNIKQFKIKYIAVYGDVYEGQEIPILGSGDDITIEQEDEGDNIKTEQQIDTCENQNQEQEITELKKTILPLQKTELKNDDKDSPLSQTISQGNATIEKSQNELATAKEKDQLEKDKTNLETVKTQTQNELTDKNKQDYKLISEELSQIDEIKNEINDLIRASKKSELTEFLNNKTKWLEAEKRYNEIIQYQNNNNLKEALRLLKSSQSWRNLIASFFVNSFHPTLKNVYETILNEIQTKLTNLGELEKQLIDENIPKEEKKSWWHKLVNFWPTVSPQPDETITQDQKNTIPEISNFLRKHPFFTKILAKFLGEKTKDLDSIVCNLSHGIFDAAANQVKIQADIAKNTVPKQAKNAIKQHIKGVIIASVAVTTLVITFIFCIINKINNNKTSSKNKKKG